MRWLVALLLTLGATAAGIPALHAAPAPGARHVASPDWRDQVIYFAMIDRFDNAEPGNDDQGEGEFDPTDSARYSGGDLRGLARRIDYIRGLGATTLWITPPVANQWWDAHRGYGGYHGYWAEDFMAVDRHYGTLADYRALAAALHGAGMYLVQDIVLNHTGNFFDYAALADPRDPGRGYTPTGRVRGRSAPSQVPFDRNDPRRPADRAAAIYHWTPEIVDYSDRTQELTWQLAGLDDLNTGSAAVREALRRSYGHWIREVGVDGFRVDTAFYVPPELFADFLDADDARAPGVLRVAAATGRRDFHVFGEGFAIDAAYADHQARRIDAYMRGAPGRVLPAMINFPLYGTTLDVLARGRPTAELGHRIRSMMALHARPHLMPTFVDNHDVDRFLAGGSPAALRQALLLIMTLPGIPTIYYGTEQGYSEQRAAMFAGGYGAGGRDHFDTGAPLYRYVARVTALRRAQRVFSRGTPDVLAESATGPGVLAYRMRDGAEQALVVLNSAERSMLLDNLDTRLAEGTRLDPLFGIDGAPDAARVGAGGRLTLLVPPRAGLVWEVGAAERVAGPAPPALVVDPLPPEVGDELAVSGRAPAGARVRVVVDGDVGGATTVAAGKDGRWRTPLDTAMLAEGVAHRVVAWADPVASAATTFTVARRWTTLADVTDPAGDDTGPTGRYRYPTDPGWGDRHQADLRRVRVLGAGGALRIELTLPSITTTWNPANGFDHVAFTLFVELPGRSGGATVMPLQHATLPDGMRWHYRVRAHGWTNALFAADGASTHDEGTTAAPAAGIAVAADASTVTFTLAAAALGHPRTLAGARVYVTTWDYDGGYRALQPEAGGHAFGGGDGARDPLVLDDALVVLR